MIFSMNLYYNLCMLEPSWYKLGTKMNINALKTTPIPLVYSSFVPFIALFQLIKSQKYRKSFSMMSQISLYSIHCVLEPLSHKCRLEINTNVLK
jgi:hypothetical protein